MAKHILFVLHGMGEHPQGWSKKEDGVENTLIDAWKQYSHFRTHGIELTDLVQFEELEYDSVFQRWRTEAGTNAEGLAARAPAGWERDVLQGLVDQQPGAADKFAHTAVLDVALYRLLPHVHNEVITHLHDQITRRLESTGGRTVSMLTHSLGTSVAHDTLALLAEDGTPRNNPWHVPSTDQRVEGESRFQFRNHFAVANVSRILQTKPKVLDSVIRPGKRFQKGCYVRNFLNFRNQLDPFPMVKRFDPLENWRNERYTSITVNHLLDFNVHGYTHYLRHPKVHAAIINPLLPQLAISDDEVVAAIGTTLRAAQINAVTEMGGMQAWADKQIDLATFADLDDVSSDVGVRKFTGMMLDYFQSVGG